MWDHVLKWQWFQLICPWSNAERFFHYSNTCRHLHIFLPEGTPVGAIDGCSVGWYNINHNWQGSRISAGKEKSIEVILYCSRAAGLLGTPQISGGARRSNQSRSHIHVSSSQRIEIFSLTSKGLSQWYTSSIQSSGNRFCPNTRCGCCWRWGCIRFRTNCNEEDDALTLRRVLVDSTPAKIQIRSREKKVYPWTFIVSLSFLSPFDRSFDAIWGGSRSLVMNQPQMKPTNHLISQTLSEEMRASPSEVGSDVEVNWQRWTQLRVSKMSFCSIFVIRVCDVALWWLEVGWILIIKKKMAWQKIKPKTWWSWGRDNLKLNERMRNPMNRPAGYLGTYGQ